MKIESLLRRKGGTKAEIDGVEYHFKPDKSGREFADVTNMDHVGIFASIREGYRIVEGEAKVSELETKAEPNPEQDNLETLDRAELADLFAERFGSRPAPRLSPEKIIEALRAA